MTIGWCSLLLVSRPCFLSSRSLTLLPRIPAIIMPSTACEGWWLFIQGPLFCHTGCWGSIPCNLSWPSPILCSVFMICSAVMLLPAGYTLWSGQSCTVESSSPPDVAVFWTLIFNWVQTGWHSVAFLPSGMHFMTSSVDRGCSAASNLLNGRGIQKFQ